MNRNLLIPYLILPLILLAAWAGPTPTPTAGGVVQPTTTPTAALTATLVPTLTPTPAKVGRWECYQGGLACSDDLYDVSMLNAEEGWAVGDNGVVLRYAPLPNQIHPTWQQMYVPLSEKQPFVAIYTVSTDEWWGVNLVILFTIKQAKSKKSPLILWHWIWR